jgi:hypothetical protein
LTHDLLRGLVGSTSYLDALAVSLEGTISRGSGGGAVAKGMTDVSWVEEDGLTILTKGVGSSSRKDRVLSPLLSDPTSASSITTLIDSITVPILLLNIL